MKRNLKAEGIIISNYRIQDYHKGTVIFTRDSGIIHAVAWGGYKGKSKLGPQVQPLTRGNFDLYSDPVKKSLKITEYEPIKLYEALKADLKKYFTALLWLETVVKAHGGGESCSELYRLVSESLDVLEMLPDDRTERMMIQFLLREVCLLGGSLFSENCGICGCDEPRDRSVFYSRKENSVICKDCASAGMAGLAEITPQMRCYIGYSLENSFPAALNAGIENNLLKYLKSLLYSIIQEYLENSLSTLQTGKEYL